MDTKWPSLHSPPRTYTASCRPAGPWSPPEDPPSSRSAPSSRSRPKQTGESQTTPICQAAAVAVAAVVSQRRRALASTWPAVNRGILPSPCCSPTTTSSAEETTGKHCFSLPPSFNSTVDGAPRRGAYGLCPWSFHSTARPSSESQECEIHRSLGRTLPGPGPSLPVRG